jgi:hypothetical protein
VAIARQCTARRLAWAAVVATSLAAAGCARTRVQLVTPIDTAPSHTPPLFTEPEAARREAEGPTAIRMRNVDFHVAPDVVLHVRRLSGELMPVAAGEPVVFDDKRSFVIRIAGADAGLTAPDLGRLLGGYVFAYDGAPLGDLRVTFEGSRLRIRGVLHKGPDLPIDIVGVLSVTTAGEIRVRPSSIKVAKVPTGTLLQLTGLHLDRLVNLKGAHGARLDGNDILLAPDSMLPPPHIHGKLTAARIEGDEVRLTFAEPALAPIAAAADSVPEDAPNFLYFRRGTLRIGKLYMVHADLEIIDAAPADPLDFSLDEYARQLAAGYVRVTLSRGLIVHMPDLHTLPAATTSAPTAAAPR